MTDQVFTHGGSDARYQMCRCHRCGKTEQCTPLNDFFTREVDGPEGPLYCERCLWEDYTERKQGRTP